jgi:hypothetical protein
MGRNLTNLYISESFQYLTQISGSELQTGLGTPITSLTITSSYSNASTSASQATSASYSNVATSASYALVSTSSSFATNATNAVSASYAVTASYALNAGASVNTGSLLVTASISNATTTFTKGDGSTFSITANNVVNANSASVATSASFATTASYVASVVSASYALSASQAANATSASYAATSTSSSYSNTSTSSSYAATATSSSYAINATSASYALSSSRAVSASIADNAISSSYALSASWAPSAGGGGAAFGFQVIYSGSSTTNGNFLFSDTGSTGLPFTANTSSGFPPFYQMERSTGSIMFGYGLTYYSSQYDTLKGALIAGGYQNNLYGQSSFTGQNFQGSAYIGGYQNTVKFGSGLSGLGMVGGYGVSLIGNINQTKFGQVVLGGYYATIGGNNCGVSLGQNEGSMGNYTDNSIINGKGNTLADFCSYAANIGGANNDVNAAYAGIIGGYYNNCNGSYNNYIYGGQENEIGTAVYNNNTIVGGQNNFITVIPDTNNPIGRFEPGASILGGRFNTISGSANFSAIIAGNNNLIQHSCSVILGGSGISTTEHYTTYVSKLVVSGSSGIQSGSTAGGGLLTMAPWSTLPAAASNNNTFAVSGSKPYFSDGSTWTALF